jgi:hypothetical protein
MPQRDLETGPVRREERHRDQVHVHEEPQRALCPAAQVEHPREEHPIDEEHAADGQQPTDAARAAEPFARRREHEIADGHGEQLFERCADDLARGERRRKDDERERGPQRLQVSHALAQRDHLAGRAVGLVLGGSPSRSFDFGHSKPRRSSSASTAASASFGSLRSTRF